MSENVEITENSIETDKKPWLFKKGQSGNPGGRPKDTLKAYLRTKLSDMTDKEKDKWIEEHKIPGDLQWRMAEGNPANNTDITSKGEKIIPIYGGLSIQGHLGDEEDISA